MNNLKRLIFAALILPAVVSFVAPQRKYLNPSSGDQPLLTRSQSTSRWLSRRKVPARVSAACWGIQRFSQGSAIAAPALGNLVVSSVGGQNLSILFSNLVGTTMVFVSLAKYLPQIRRIIRSESVAGLAPAAYYGDSLVFCTKSAYHFRRGHPVSAWGELLVLFAQNVAIVGLLHRFRKSTSEDRTTQSNLLLRDAAGFAVFLFCLTNVPNSFLPFLSVFTAPLLIASYSAQIRKNRRKQSTGQLSPGTVFLRLFGSFVRLATTVTQLGGDLPVLINHGIGVGGCSFLLGQIWFYGRAPNIQQTSLAPGSTSGTKLLLGAQQLPQEKAPSFRSATLMWRSLGGFDTDEKARPSTRKLRAAFTSLDHDGSGSISIDEVAAALASSNPGVPLKTAQQMIKFADRDGNDLIDFEEFELAVNACGIQCE